MQTFYCPVRLYMGPDALQALTRETAKRVMIVTDRYFSQNGLAQKIGAMIPGAEVQIFDKVVPDPPASLAAEGAALCSRFRPELLMALGGGSPMDCAKAIRLASETPMRFVAIPTTSGSGSEMTAFSILTHEGVKHPVIDDAMRPDAAILDDTLLQELPASLAADTGMDLLAHCLEAVAAARHNALTDALAYYAADTVLRHLEASCQGDRSVRGRIHVAASMAGMAFDQAGLGVCHAMAHALGGEFHLPHGKLCAMLLPHVMRLNAPASMAQYGALALRCGLPAPTDRLGFRNLSAAIVRLREKLGMPATLQKAGVDPAEIRLREEKILQAALRDRCCETNPVPVAKEMLKELYWAVSG